MEVNPTKLIDKIIQEEEEEEEEEFNVNGSQRFGSNEPS